MRATIATSVCTSSTRFSNVTKYAHTAELRSCKVRLTFYANDGHLYPITDNKLRDQISINHRIKLERLQDKMSIEGDNYNYSKKKSYLDISQCKKQFVLVETNDLSDLVKDTIIATQMLIHQISFSQSHVSMFRHPVTEQVIIAAHNYSERKAIADKLYRATTMYIKFKFTNQSFCQLAKYHLRCFLGELPMESYGPEQLKMFEASPRTPLVCRSAPYVMQQHWAKHSVDVRRSYSGILINNKHDFPVFHYSDKVEPFVGDEFPVGVYFVSINIVMSVATIPKGWYSLPAVEYFFFFFFFDNFYLNYVTRRYYRATLQNIT
jgi:hypothetical protein